MLNEKIKQYWLLMRLHKPIGILLLLWPTLWALWLAGNGMPDMTVLTVFCVGVVLTRSAGCIINDFADRDFDGSVKRTQMRPLANQKIRVREALLMFGALMLVAFLLVVVFLNRYTIYLALIGAMLAVVYPFLKRITHLPQLGLGFAFSWGVPMAFAAVNNAVPMEAWLLYAAAILWPLIYDTMYAMTDRDDDIRIGVKSTAILFGRHDVLILGVLQITFLASLAVIGTVFELQWPFFLSLFLSAGFFLYQQYLMKDRDPTRCFHAFLNNNWVGLVLFLGIVWSKLL